MSDLSTPSVASLLAHLALGDKANGERENGLHACAEIYGEGELEEDDGGEAVLEFKVHGLVVPNLHAEPCPNASAHEGKEEQCGFRYAPPALPGLEFVYAIYDERNDIDAENVTRNYVVHSKQITLF